MFRTARRTAALTIAATGIAVLAGFATASAHIEPDPPAIEAGKQATVGFLVEHGCGDANTTGLDIKLPDGVTDATASEDGWQVAVADGVVRFSGGNLDAHTEQTFSLTFTAPATPGTVLFPIVQTCGETELSWLDVAAEGQPEPEHPAPAVKITQGPPTSDDLTVAPDDDADADATGSTTGGAGAASTPTTTPAITLVPTVTVPASTATSDDDSSAGVIVLVIVVVVVAAGVVGVLVARRRRGSGGPGPSTGTGPAPGSS